MRFSASQKAGGLAIALVAFAGMSFLSGQFVPNPGPNGAGGVGGGGTGTPNDLMIWVNSSTAGNFAGSTSNTCGAGSAASSVTISATGVESVTCVAAGGVTNSAGNNVITKSNGTNLVASGVTDNAVTVSTAERVAASGNYGTTSLTSDLVGMVLGVVTGGTFAAPPYTGVSPPLFSGVLGQSFTGASAVCSGGGCPEATVITCGVRGVKPTPLTGWNNFAGGDFGGCFDSTIVNTTEIVGTSVSTPSVTTISGPLSLVPAANQTTTVGDAGGTITLQGTVANTGRISATTTSAANLIRGVLTTAGGTVNNLAAVGGLQTGTFDTTAAVLTNFGVNGSASGTRSAGANNLLNIGGFFTASNAQINRAIEATSGDVALNVGSGITSFGGTQGGTLAITGANIIDARTAPTVNHGSINAASTNFAGNVTSVGAFTSVTITFANSGFAANSWCVITANGHTVSGQYFEVTRSSTAPVVSCFTATTAVAANCDDFTYICVGGS